MTKRSKSQLLTTSAIASLAALQLAPAAQAQESYGIHNDQPETLVITVEDGETVEGESIGIYADNGAIDLTVEEGGEVRGNGNFQGSADERPDGGVVIAQADSTVVNSGLISGAANGIATSAFFSEDENGDPLPPEKLAERVSVTNTESGSIIGEGGHGVALVFGGTVDNSGFIQGSGGTNSAGVLVAALGDVGLDETGTGVGTITNSSTGVIQGQNYGVLLGGGGTIENAGTIAAALQPQGGSAPAGVVVAAGADQAGRLATIDNSGTITGFIGFIASGNLEATTLNNSGVVSGQVIGVLNNLVGGGTLTINNSGEGLIQAGGAAIQSNIGGLVVNNGEDATIASSNSSAMVISQPGTATIDNAGTIEGQYYGILTQAGFNPQTGAPLPSNGGITVTNSGTIRGRNDDGMRLEGGGSVTNSGTIAGEVGDFADGVSMFPGVDQANGDYSASVTNLEGGEISGNRFGVILSGGGTIDNAGDISGNVGGALVQGIALNSDTSEDRAGLNATITNSGTIRGLGSGEDFSGYGVSFGSDLGTATLVNSGTISSENGIGVFQGSSGDLVIQNLEGGMIVGATQGVFGATEGSITIDNAGTIRGNGVGDPIDSPSGAAVNIATADSSVTNSGTIEGAGFGITTNYAYDEEAQMRVGIAIGTQIENSGTISGESNDGVRLIGGGSVTNSGTISGAGGDFADGVSMFRYDGQAQEGYSAVVTNDADGTIEGARYGVILSMGGTVDNAGTIAGNTGGVLIQGSGIDGETGMTADVVNSGTITGAEGYGVVVAANLDEASVTNSGTIAGADVGVLLGTTGTATLVNTGAIEGGNVGVLGDDTGPVVLDNAGTIAGGSGLAVQLGGFDDTITLRTGSHLDGALDAGEGVDSLTLAGEVLELTDEQVVGTTLGVEDFTVASGYWSTEGFVGQFDTLTIDAGGALQVNEFAQGEDFTSPIFTTSGLVTDNGLLVLNFSGDDVLSQFDSLAITGEGAVKLIGEAVFTVDGDTLTYTGGTTIANGGVILTGTLPGSVTTEGDGFFQLGVGGTEGVFDGDIVNNGRFVFDRSDDYDFLGAFSGSGILDKYGDGTLTFMGDYGFEGVTNIFAGAVRIGGTINPETDFNLGENASLDITGMDQTIGGLSGEETAEVELGEQTLTVDQEENTEFAGVISGLGGIVKDGDGILNLSGDSTYTGPTEVDGGKLAVNGSIVSNITVNAGGTLGGNGTVGDTVVNGDGTLAPGNSIGRLTVDGDLAFAAGSIYEVEVNAAGEGDRVDATGAVTIADTASVSVLAAEGAYAPRTDYIIVTGADGVTGTFGSVTTDMAFLDPLLRYSADTVTLSLYRNDVDFADVAANANQASVAGAVQALGIDNPLFEAVLMQNATTAQASFGDLSGEILASTISGLTDDSRHLRNAMLAMAAPKEAGLFVWGSAFGGWGDFDATARNFGMNADHKGAVAGIGFGGRGFAVAVSGGVGGSDFDLDGRGDAADVSSTYLAAHATLGAPGGFHGAAGVSYAWHDIDTARTVSGAAFGQSLASARDADTLQVFGEIGYDVMTGSIAITPFARLAHVNTESDAFTETGGNAALAVRKAKQETTFLSLGAKARFNADSEGFQPYVSAAWNRAFGDRSAVVSSQFVAGGPAFSIAGVEIPKNSAEVEAGFDYTAGAFSIGVAYSGTLASDRTTHGARITGKIAF